ncbi:GNAT family N-acetyltransferase [Gryllotalpicola protaetiae]|uniref:GNAT family N-acetyltransferase n=1 Tax=Gryllotalpicola protaetiae TaxID=2419771 RepID=A0A387BSC5_9MICO|nr:GNAT family N-acetyltransferase [Gryllotalpicola protaetiae]AYG03960.1 GNAT family N-acetyltransferase [Gryllotalpicola protaetiae]
MPDLASPEQTVRIERVEWEDDRAARLRAAMDAEIAPRYADLNAALTDEQAAARADAFVLDPATLRGVYLALEADGTPIGHAALRRLEVEGAPVAWELKRLITLPAARGRGVGALLIEAVEADAAAAGATRVVLQTGIRQPEAVGLYEKLGYAPIAAYPPYADRVPEGIYFARELHA